MIKILHISDLHYGRVDESVESHFFAALEQLNPDLLIISGDLTQRAKRREFEQVEKFLNQLTMPYFIIPGNHDLAVFRFYERLFYPWKKWERFIKNHLEPSMHFEDIAILGINTTKKLGSRFDLTKGSINRRQNATMHQFFTQSDATFKILVAHHPFWLPSEHRHRDTIQGKERAIKTLNDTGVDLILGGHIHIPFAKLYNNIIISHAGTTLSSRLKKSYGNSFNLIEIVDNQITITLFEHSKKRFVSKEKHGFVKNSGVWSEQTKRS